MNRLLRINDVKKITSLSNATIYRKIAAGSFPRQFKLSERASAWVEQEVLDWVDERISERDLSA